MAVPKLVLRFGKNFTLQGEGGTVAVLLALGVFSVAMFAIAVVVGEARGYAMMAWGVLLTAVFLIPSCFYIYKNVKEG